MGGSSPSMAAEIGTLSTFTELLAGAAESKQVVMVPVTELYDSPYQPKGRTFDPAENEEDAQFRQGLEDRVAAVGADDAIIQPLLLRMRSEGGYFIIEGHRRKYASLAVGIERVPAIVTSVDDVEGVVQMGIANLQRSDLTPLQEGYQLLAIMTLTGEKAAAAGRRIGMAERTAQQRVQLTELPPAVQTLYEQESLTQRQALACSDEAWGGQVGELAAEQGLTADQISTVIERLRGNGATSPEEAVAAVVAVTPTAASPKKQPKTRGKRRKRPALDYAQVVRDDLKDLRLTERERELLTELAQVEKLGRVAVRWAGLVASSSSMQRPSSGVAYAQQLDASPIGSALRAGCDALERLERRVGRSGQLTENLVTATRIVIEDMVTRLQAVSAAMDGAKGAVCAATVPSESDEE
jgi:ParB/RepB/Spo0J family partition protein